MRKTYFLVAFLSMFFLISYVQAQTTDKANQIDAGFDSLKVANTDSVNKIVYYLPVKPTIVNSQGKIEKQFEIIQVNSSSVLISGSVALQANIDELETLKQRAIKLYGQDAQIKESQTVSYKMWIDLKGQTISELPESSGLLKPIPVQLLTSKPKNGEGIVANFYFSIVHNKNLEPYPAKITIDWQRAMPEILTGIPKSGITSKDIETIAVRLFDKNLLKVEALSNEEIVNKSLLLPYIEFLIESEILLLQEKTLEDIKTELNQSQENNNIRKYSFKKNIEKKAGIDQISFNVARIRQHSFTFSKEIILYR